MAGETAARARARTIPAVILSTDGPSRTIRYERGQLIFRQGDPCDGIYLIQSGRVRLTVASAAGRQATVAFLGSDEVFGEQCLIRGGETRLMSSFAASATEVVKITLEPARALIQTDVGFAAFILQCVVRRVAQYEQTLVHQIINKAEQRLARALLRLSSFNLKKPKPSRIEDVSQEMLAELVGASRPRINGFMTKFRRLGHIEYSGKRIIVKPSLLSVLFDPPRL